VPIGAWAASLSNILLISAYAVNLVWRQHAPARVTMVGTGMLALSASCMAVLCVSGFLGGRLTYRYGVRVAAEGTQATGYRTGQHYAQPESDYR
jgi:uncharacterized membrane protein